MATRPPGGRFSLKRLWRIQPDRPVRAPLVLIHGMSASARAWDPILPFLEGRREVHVVTLPGHRGGRRLTDPLSLRSEDYVDAVERELDRLGLEEPDIVGNSLGGWVAL